MNPKIRSEVTIRRAGEEDKSRLISLINAAYRVEDFFKYDDRVNRQELEECFEQGLFFVALEKDLLQACIYLELKTERAYFGLLSVDPACQ
ncbi:MAG TPA: hypothetical protein VNZ86_19255, partial [Bacteroidia bacterium]|nr:hypothetical protein [Bacteroidia bacterium]